MILAASEASLTAARQQMALSLGYHIILACFGIGLPLLTVLAEWWARRTGQDVYLVMAKRWAKTVGVLFAVGAVTGTILSFELGILWPGLMGEFGDVLGLPFAIEGFAFFIEAIFIGIYLYGWDRLPPRLHLLSGVPIVVAGVASAFFVISANAFMQQPQGFDLVDGEVTNVRPLTAMFNPALWPQATHMILAALMVSAFGVAAFYAFTLLRGGGDYQRRAFILAFAVGAVITPFQIVAGDWAARFLYEYQPTKLAAIEGLNETGPNAPLTIGGWYSDGEVHWGIEIPSGLSLLVGRSTDTVVVGLDATPEDERPPVAVVRQAFQVMVAIGFFLLALSSWFGWSWWRHRSLPPSRLFLGAAVAAGPLTVVALEAGWIVTEVGRQPWIVWQVMRVEDAVTAADGIAVGYGVLVGVYAVLTVGTVVVLRRLARNPLLLPDQLGGGDR